MSLPPINRFEGAILGAACGDALGAWTEDLTPSAIRARFKGRVSDFPNLKHPYLRKNGTYLFTDDTQLTLCVASSLIEKTGFNAQDLAAKFVSWSTSPDNFRTPSRTFMRAARLLQTADLEGQTGIPSTCGAGAARTVPVGLYYATNSSLCAKTAAQIASLTHADPCAEAAAAAVALIVAELAKGTEPEAVVQTIMEPIRKISSTFADSLMIVESCSALDEEAAFNCLGRGVSAAEIITSALYCILVHPKDFKSAVLTAVNGGGKADSIASVAGAFSGSYLGVGAIPDEWLQAIEAKEELQKTAHGLFDLAKELANS